MRLGLNIIIITIIASIGIIIIITRKPEEREERKVHIGKRRNHRSHTVPVTVTHIHCT
jgi:hypothetical protein